jgi:TRAP-type C4-dicarboxylate transport system substrate-binding protein
LPVTGEAQSLKVTLLGTGDPVPRIDRFGPSTLVQTLTVMNQKTWSSLPTDIQKIIDEMSPWAEEIQAKAWAGTRGYAVSVAKKSNIELIEFPPAEKNRWVEISTPIEEEWAKETDPKGLPASRMVKEIKQMLAR